MAAIEFDYGAIKSAINTTKSMSGCWGAYETYRSSLDYTLYDPLADWRLSAKEPWGHTFVSDARGEISYKRAELESRMGEWSVLSNNIQSFKEYVDGQDQSVKNIFDITSSQYTDYTGVRGYTTAFFDFCYSNFVNGANSITIIREIRGWTRPVYDDWNATIRDRRAYFIHGEGRYAYNIAKSVATTAIAVLGTIAAIAAIPFDGGTTAPIAVASFAAATSGIASIITAFNTGITINSNLNSRNIEGDPALARYYSDIDSYADFAERRVYGSPEAYFKNVRFAHGLEIFKNSCEVLSLATGFAHTIGLKKVETIIGEKVYCEYVYDFGFNNIKTNFLKMFGIKTNETVTDEFSRVNTEVTQMDFDDSIGLPEGSRTLDTSRIVESPRFGMEDVRIVNPNNPNDYMIYTSRNLTNTVNEITPTISRTIQNVDGFTVNYVYSRTEDLVSISNGYDFGRMFMTQNSAARLSNLTSMNDMVRYGYSLNSVHTLEVCREARFALNAANTALDFLGDPDGRSGTDTIRNIIRTNNFGYNIDRYIYSLPTGSEPTGNDFLQGIGGTTGREVWEVVEGCSDLREISYSDFTN